jgi:ABC-type multidrug transport system fused ATPase/permease subunit
MRFMTAINFSSWRVLDSAINEKAAAIRNELYEIPGIQSKINRAWEFSHGSYIEIYQAGLEALRYLVQLIGIFVSLYIVSLVICIVSLLAVVPAVISKFINDKLSFFSKRSLSEDENELKYYKNAVFNQPLLKEIILKCAFPFFQKKYERKAEYIFWKTLKVEAKKSRLILLNESIRSIVMITCILFASYKFINGDMSIGGIAVIFTLIVNVIYILADLVSNVCSVFTLTYNIKQFYEFMDLDSRLEPGNKTLFNISGDNEVVFENVSYRYPMTGRKVINNITVRIKAGQHIAIVGANGSGKSTFIKLLIKLIEPSSGRIFYGGEDVKAIDGEKYWKLFSTVFQDYNKYKESLRYNAGIGDLIDILNDCRLSNSLKDAGFNKNIGLECMLSKEFGGIELSEGEWQKIAIARSLFKNGQIYILDEPTAAIDPVKEAELYKMFYEICKDKTSVFVTHRLGSVLYSDLVLFFKNGMIIESGTHEELLLLNGEYAQFWNMQAGLYKSAAI